MSCLYIHKAKTPSSLDLLLLLASSDPEVVSHYFIDLNFEKN